MVKTQLLDEAIKKSGLRTDYLANSLGITRVSFSNKKNGHRDFKLSEITVLCMLLKLDADERDRIFFPDVSSDG